MDVLTNPPIFLPVDRSFGMPPANKLDMSKGPPLFLGASAAGLGPPPPPGRGGPADVGDDFFPVIRTNKVKKCQTYETVTISIITHILQGNGLRICFKFCENLIMSTGKCFYDALFHLSFGLPLSKYRLRLER